MMKRFLGSIVVAVVLFGCAGKRIIPPEDIYVFVEGLYPVKIEKGFLSERENYMTAEEFEALFGEVTKDEIGTGI